MRDDTLEPGAYDGHLMVAALTRHHDTQLVYLGVTALRGLEVAQRISQYVQAFEAFEALGRGPAPAALPALNRPEVLFILGTGQTQVLTIWPVPEELAHVGEDPAAAAETFGAVQAPKQVIGIDALPVTALGKPAKKALRVQFWGEGVLSVG